MTHTIHIDGVPKKAKYFLPSGAVCGNGKLCLMYGSDTGALTIHIGKTDFWKGLPGGRSDGGIKTVGSLRVCGFDPKHMHTEQRLEEGALYSTCGDVQWTVFVAPDNTAVLRFEQPTACTPIQIELLPGYGCGSFSCAKRIGKTAEMERAFRGEGLLFETAAYAVLREEEETRDGCRVQTFYLTVVTNHETPDCKMRAQTLSKIADFNTLRAAHDRRWQDFWAASSVMLSDKAVETQWYADLYLLACCCGDPAFPPGLYGNFIQNDNVPWHGDYHLNYNYQAPFYGVFAANHPELSDGYETPLLQFMPEGERNAREFLSCRGIYYPVGIGPRGLNTSSAPSLEQNEMFHGQKSDAAYGAVIMILRWNATRDIAYARKVYPYLRAVTDFFEDYMTFEDGRYQIKNDAIHEVPFYWEGFEYGCEDDFSTDTNNLLTLGLVRMVFRAADDMALALGRDADKHELWHTILDKLTDFPTFTRKRREVFRYTEQGRDWCEDNSLCIQHIYPAGQIGLGSEAHLLQVARNTYTVEDRSTDDNGTNSYLPAGARIGMSEAYLLQALHKNYAASRLPNGLFDHAGGGIENNNTTLATVNEMLLQSHEGIVRLFPVWESDAAFVSLRADGAFLVSAEQRGGEVRFARIKAEQDGTLCVENPFVAARVTLPDGTKQVVRGIITVPMRAGEQVRIEAKE